MKRLQINDRIKQLMQTNLGNLPSETDVAVFETVLADGQPLRKTGTIWENAVLQPSFLQELAASIRPNETVPLQIMHNDYVLPVGRVFHAWMDEAAAVPRGLFFTTDQKLASDIDNSVIDSVSIGSLSRQLNCSECGWDYRGVDASIMNFIDRTCANDHTIGTDGVHLNCNGCENWMELSLVGNGAAGSAKIASRTTAILKQHTEMRDRLAASGRLPAEALVLFASHSGEDPMDVKEFTTQLTTQVTEIATLKASATEVAGKLTAAQTQVTEVTGKLTAAETKVTELTTQVTDLTVKATVAAETVAYLKEQAKAALVATGKPVDSIPDDVAALIAVIKAAKTNLINLIPAGGVAHPAGATGETSKNASLSAFTNRKL